MLELKLVLVRENLMALKLAGLTEQALEYLLVRATAAALEYLLVLTMAAASVHPLVRATAAALEYLLVLTMADSSVHLLEYLLVLTMAAASVHLLDRWSARAKGPRKALKSAPASEITTARAKELLLAPGLATLMVRAWEIAKARNSHSGPKSLLCLLCLLSYS